MILDSIDQVQAVEESEEDQELFLILWVLLLLLTNQKDFNELKYRFMAYNFKFKLKNLFRNQEVQDLNF